MKKVWFNGKMMDAEVGMRVLVASCGLGHSIFGEFATLERFTSTNMIFKTDKGTIVKSKIDSFTTIGKAHKSGYFVSPIIEGREDLIESRVSYWNDKKLCMEYK